MSGWEPISTAPLQTEEVLVWNGRGVHIARRRSAVHGTWCGQYSDKDTISDVTHWMPIPYPPTPADDDPRDQHRSGTHNWR